MKTKVALLLAVLFAGTFFTNTAAIAGGAPDPATVARRCVHEMNQRAHRGARAIAHICQRTLAEIREAIANGDRDAARAAAERGSMLACRVEHATVQQLRMITEDCVRILHRLGADPELIRRVVDAGQRRARFVSAVKDRCLAAIRDALGDGG